MAWLLLLSMLWQVAASPADPLDLLAAGNRWEELRDQAELRLRQDPDDELAHYWLGRDLLGQALELSDGSAVGRDLALNLLDRSVEHLGVVRPHAEGTMADAVDWWLEARYARAERTPAGDGTRDRLAADLQSMWDHDQVATAGFLSGLLAEQAGDPKALDWYDRAAHAAPGRSRFWQRLALALAGVGRRDEALDAFDHALAAPDAWLDDLLAVLLTMLPGRRDAELRLQRLEAMVTHPEWSEQALLGWHRAHALHQLGREQAALEALDRGRQGRTAEIDRAHASFLLSAGRPEQALELLLPRVRERDWACLDESLLAIGRLLALRRFEPALAACDALLEFEPRHELVLWNRALILWRAGRDDQARQAFDTLLARLPGRTDALNDAALAAWGAGDLTRARELLEQAVTLPDSGDARENLALLLLEQAGGSPAEQAAESRRVAAELLESVLADQPDRARALYARHLCRALP